MATMDKLGKAKLSSVAQLWCLSRRRTWRRGSIGERGGNFDAAKGWTFEKCPPAVKIGYEVQVSNKPVSPAMDTFHNFGHFGLPQLPPRGPSEADFDRARLEIG